MLAKQYLAPNTNSTYFWGQACFLEFCILFKKWPPLPASDQALAQWIYRAATIRDLAVKSIKTYAFGIRALHLQNGHRWTCWTERFLVYQALRSIKRIFGEARRTGKLEITLKILRGLVRWADSAEGRKFLRSEENVATFQAQCLVAFFGILRKDNVAVAKQNSFNPNRHLCRGDFVVDQAEMDNEMVPVIRMTVRHSKTIQFDDRCHEVLFVFTGNDLCPVSAVQRCFDATPQRDSEGPAFVWKSGRRYAPATHATFVRAVKAGVQALGLDPNNYAGISFRRGGATCAADSGVDKELVKELGDWKSNAYELYCKRSMKQRLVLPAVLAKLARNT